MVDDESKSEKNTLSREDLTKPGVTISYNTRPLLIERLERSIREGDVIIRSERTVKELQTFIWKNGRVEAAEGCHDDLCMSLATGLWVRDTALRIKCPSVFKPKATAEPSLVYFG